MTNPFGFGSYHGWGARHPIPFNLAVGARFRPPFFSPPPAIFIPPAYQSQIAQHVHSDLDLRTDLNSYEHQQQPMLPSPMNSSSNKAEMEEWKIKCHQSMEEKNAIKKQLEAKTKECNSLQGSVNDLQKKLKAMGATSMPKDLSELRNEKKALIKDKSDLEKKCKEKDETITKLKKGEVDSKKMAETNRKKEEEHRKMTKQKDQLVEEQQTEIDKLKTELRKKEETIQEQKKQSVEKQRTEIDKLKTEMCQKQQKALTEQKNQLMEKQRERNDKLRTVLCRNKEEALVEQKEQLMNQSRKQLEELKANLQKQFEQCEKKLVSRHKAEIEQLKTEHRAETEQQMSNSPFDEQHEVEHCGEKCKRNRTMVAIYKTALSKHAKEGTCAHFKPLLFDFEIVQTLQNSGIPHTIRQSETNDLSQSANSDQNTSAFADSLRNIDQCEVGLKTRTNNLNGVLTDGQATTNPNHGTENALMREREDENQSMDQLRCANASRQGEVRPPSLERSESVANSLPSVNFTQSPQDHFEELKQQTREKIAQELRLPLEDHAVEIRVQQEMAIYNKKTMTVRQVLVEELGQQQNPSTPSPTLTMNGPITVVGTANAPSTSNQNRQRETEELLQMFASAGSVHPQLQKQPFQSPNVRQITPNQNSTTTERPSKQKKRKLTKSSSVDQQPNGVEPKYPRQTAQPQVMQVQQQTSSPVYNQNILIHPNFVGFQQPTNSQLLQTVQQQLQMSQQCRFPAVMPAQQQMQQQICGSSTSNANCWVNEPLYAQQQQTVPSFVPQAHFSYPPLPLPSHNQQPFQHQQQQFARPLCQQQPVNCPMAFQPSKQIQQDLSQQQSSSRHFGATQLFPSDFHNSTQLPTVTTPTPIEKQIVLDFLKLCSSNPNIRDADALVKAFLNSRSDMMTIDQMHGVFPQLLKLADEVIRGIKQTHFE